MFQGGRRRGDACLEAFERPSVSLVHIRGPGAWKGGHCAALGAGWSETGARATDPLLPLPADRSSLSCATSSVPSWYLMGLAFQDWTWGRAVVLLQVPGDGSRVLPRCPSSARAPGLPRGPAWSPGHSLNVCPGASWSQLPVCGVRGERRHLAWSCGGRVLSTCVLGRESTCECVHVCVRACTCVSV